MLQCALTHSSSVAVWVLWNKDSISPVADRQLQNYLQHYCNAARKGEKGVESEAHKRQ